MYIYIRILKTIEKGKIYIISPLYILVSLTYIKAILHIYHYHIKREKNVTIYLTNILAVQNTTNISCLNIKTVECYNTIGARHFIGFVDAAKTSNQHINTTELYITNGDADIFVYIGVIKKVRFRAIDDTRDIEYPQTAETSNANIETREPDIIIGDTVYDLHEYIVKSIVAKGKPVEASDPYIERGK